MSYAAYGDNGLGFTSFTCASSSLGGVGSCVTGSVGTGVTSLAATDSCVTGSAGTGVTSSLAATDSCPQSKCREIKKTILNHRREIDQDLLMKRRLKPLVEADKDVWKESFQEAFQLELMVQLFQQLLPQS